MRASPSVSVCMPIYNGLPHLPEAIASVLGQTHRDFEVIISLDGSTDGSSELCRALDDPRVVVIRNDRPGLFSNLNNAIGHSSGRYIQVFCQDDVMEPGLLADQVREMEAWPDVAMVVARERTLDAAGNLGPVTLHSLEDEPMDLKLYMWRAAHYASIASNISSIMLSRRALETVGLFDESYRFAGDVELYNRVATVGRVRAASANHIRIRSHSGQASRSLAAASGFISEEVRIYQGFWREVLPAKQWRAVFAFRASTRGATHVRTGLREILRGRIAEGARIVAAAVMAYGFWRPIQRVKSRRVLEPQFESGAILLGDVQTAARRAAARGLIPTLAPQTPCA